STPTCRPTGTPAAARCTCSTTRIGSRNWVDHCLFEEIPMEHPLKPSGIQYALGISMLLCIICAVAWLQAERRISALENVNHNLSNAISEVQHMFGEPEQKAPVVKVSCEDLAAGGVVVNGRLGVPLKTMLTLRGIWHQPNNSGEAATKASNIR